MLSFCQLLVIECWFPSIFPFESLLTDFLGGGVQIEYTSCMTDFGFATHISHLVQVTSPEKSCSLMASQPTPPNVTP